MVDYEQVYDDLTRAQKSISLFMKSECITETEKEEQFDRIVQKAYQDSVLHPVLDDAGPQEAMEPEETSGMSMGM